MRNPRFKDIKNLKRIVKKVREGADIEQDEISRSLVE